MLFPSSRVFSFLIVVQIYTGSFAIAQELPFNSHRRLPADVGALSVSGPSGGLTIPDARVLSDGAVAFGWSNTIDPRYVQATHGDNYLFGMGFLPYVEISGRLTNYRNGGVRDLSANVKLSAPKIFRWQPDLSVGMNDLGGGASLFRSTYFATGKRFGALRTTLGVAKGEPYLNGFFGGAELALGNTGLSLLAERNNHANHAGLRYGSTPITGLANANIVVTVQRSLGERASSGSNFDRTTVGLNLLIPFGKNARTVKTPQPASDSIWTPPPAYRNQAQPTSVTESVIVSGSEAVAQVSKPSSAQNGTLSMSILQKLQAALEKAGLERVRVGIAGNKLVIEYENHRYGQNEVDAIGIALGLGTQLAPMSIVRIGVVTKKAGLVLYETSVDREHYRSFMNDGDVYDAREGLEVKLRPVADHAVQWADRSEGARGYSRILMEPVLKSFVGTEVGVYDYSLAASIQGIVPLWKGAELSASYVRNVSDSENVRNGPFFYASQRSGLKSATLNQSFWLIDNVLNITSGGKFLYDYAGIQNETIFFVPGRDDQMRFQYTRLKYSDAFLQSTIVNMGGFYRWNYQPLNLWVELGYSKYVENDRGPSVRVSRWFGDIQAQAYIRRSDQATFAGFQLAFPLTPRRGMRPGYTHIEGPGQFAYGLETKLATQGNCNCITRGVAEEIPIAYSARSVLLNQGRVGRDYLATQLPRMREAALLFGPLE
jgi:hypothetical protein